MGEVMDGESGVFAIPLEDTVACLCLGKERANTLVVTCPSAGVKIFEVRAAFWGVLFLVLTGWKVFDRQCIKNWTSTTQLHLRGPASQDPKSGRFFAAVGGENLTSWGHNALDISSRTDQKVRSHSIHSRKERELIGALIT